MVEAPRSAARVFFLWPPCSALFRARIDPVGQNASGLAVLCYRRTCGESLLDATGIDDDRTPESGLWSLTPPFERVGEPEWFESAEPHRRKSYSSYFR